MKAKVPRMYTQAHMEERIQYLDMLALMVLHEVFGFGAERLKWYYRAIGEVDAEYSRYRDPRTDPGWGQKDKLGVGRVDIWKLKRDLHAIGFDYDEMVDEGSAEEDERKGIK